MVLKTFVKEVLSALEGTDIYGYITFDINITAEGTSLFMGGDQHLTFSVNIGEKS